MLYQRGEGVRLNWKRRSACSNRRPKAATRRRCVNSPSWRSTDAASRPISPRRCSGTGKPPKLATRTPRRWSGISTSITCGRRISAKRCAGIRRAADTGNAAAMYSLSTIYGDGRGVPAGQGRRAGVAGPGAGRRLRRRVSGNGASRPAPGAARSDRRRAVANAARWPGDGQCAYRTSRHRKGASDDEAAVNWLRRGAELRNPNACFVLYERTRLGEGVPRDPLPGPTACCAAPPKARPRQVCIWSAAVCRRSMPCLGTSGRSSCRRRGD